MCVQKLSSIFISNRHKHKRSQKRQMTVRDELVLGLDTCDAFTFWGIE